MILQKNQKVKFDVVFRVKGFTSLFEWLSFKYYKNKLVHDIYLVNTELGLCSCLGWYYGKSLDIDGRRQCRHLKELINKKVKVIECR